MKKHVLLAVTENLEICVREIDHKTGEAKSTAHFIINKRKFHVYAQVHNLSSTQTW